MLHIREIQVYNFRPYYAQSPRDAISFDFGDKDGLSIVLGDNGVGKSSLLKAIKYVLYGELESRGVFSVKDELNIISYEEQRYEFWVALRFDYNNDLYMLKRWTKLKDNVVTPLSDKDFISDYTITKNDKMLLFSEKSNVIKNIIPKNISEFILFEGETIAKYKELLDSNRNTEIYDSIKRILGTKALDNTVIDLQTQFEEIDKLKHKKIRENSKNAVLRDRIGELEDEIDNLKSEIEEISTKLEDTTQNISELDTFFTQNQRSRELVKKKGEIQGEIQKKKGINDTLRDNIKELFKKYKSFAYDYILYMNLKTAEIFSIEQNIESNRGLKSKLQELYRDIEKGNCDHCGHKFNDREISEINEKITDLKSQLNEPSNDELKKYKEFKEKETLHYRLIGQIEHKNIINDIKSIEIEIITNNIELDKLQGQVKGINDQLSESESEQEITQKVKEYSTLNEKKNKYQEILNKLVQQMEAKKQEKSSFSHKVEAEIDLSQFDQKLNRLKLWISIFEDSRKKYAIHMREKVQKDATEMFINISENKEYSRLEFDEFYGLKLYDNENRVVPNPSDGYRVLLTISLIYGLHKNSTLAGSIILDAPFSTLTEFHRDNIVASFQKLSPQVILLVYKDQINISHIQEIMKEKLQKEFEIYQDRNEHNSSYKTQRREKIIWQN